jgi:DNA-binding NtrC family response regulator
MEFQKRPNASILIVDDEQGVRESLRMILKPSYNIYLSQNGEEALTCIQKNKIDMVLLDLRMPGMSGLDTLREIKKISEDIDVIIVTAYGTIANVQEAIASSVSDFITKPFDVFEVLHVVNKTIRKRCDILKTKALFQKIRSLSEADGKVPPNRPFSRKE